MGSGQVPSVCSRRLPPYQCRLCTRSLRKLCAEDPAAQGGGKLTGRAGVLPGLTNGDCPLREQERWHNGEGCLLLQQNQQTTAAKMTRTLMTPFDLEGYPQI